MSREINSESIYRAPESDTTFAPQGDLLAAYVGPKNADYYARKFENFKSGGGAMSWHWPAFFISAWWFLYRKMWLIAFLYWIVLPIGLSVLSTVVAVTAGPDAGALLYYGVYLVIAFLLVPIFANRLYYRHAQKKADKVASVVSSAEQQSAELSRIGGTSNVVLVLVPFILIAIVGILAAIAIPAYNDYTIRAQVSEGLNLSGGAKAAVTEYYMDSDALPANNDAAGLIPANQITGKYVMSVGVHNGSIVVTYGNDAHEIIQAETLVLEPNVGSAGTVEWTCRSPSIPPKHLPAACR